MKTHMDSRIEHEEDALLKPRQVAEMLGVELQTLALQRFRGTGPAYIKMSDAKCGRVRYRRSDVMAYINSLERIEPVRRVA